MVRRMPEGFPSDEGRALVSVSLDVGKTYHQLFVRYDKFARGLASAGGPRW